MALCWGLIDRIDNTPLLYSISRMTEAGNYELGELMSIGVRVKEGLIPWFEQSGEIKKLQAERLLISLVYYLAYVPTITEPDLRGVGSYGTHRRGLRRGRAEKTRFHPQQYVFIRRAE